MTNVEAGFGRPRLLGLLLGVSLLANIVLGTMTFYPYAIENLLVAMQTPPSAVASDHIRGNPKAQATIIAYIDFQCPYCARLHASLRSLTGATDARLIYRHFPLPSHPQAVLAAEAAECAGDQGKFWEYSDALFAPDLQIKGRSTLDQLASDIGIDTNTFAVCVSSGKFKQRVAAQREEGIKKRIRGTPTFFVNGKRFGGVLPDDQLKQLVAANAP